MSEILEVVVDWENFQQKSKTFFEEEGERRKRAMAFADKITEILLPVANQIFAGPNYFDSQKHTVSVGKNAYFRWEKYHIGNFDEEPGFYGMSSVGNYLGVPLRYVSGPIFWGIVRSIVDWLPEVHALLDAKDESRDRLLTMLNV